MTQYVGIRSEGGLIPYDILAQIAKEESGLGQQAKDFGLPAGRRLTDEIARAWSDVQDYWHIFHRRSASLPESETGTTLTRKWVSDLLNELLGYELTYQPSGVVKGGKNYPISHRAGSGEESPPIQIEGFRTDLDRRPEGRRLSPQALVQEYLNNSDSHLWGIVTNGFLLRLLRDTSRTSRPSYLEFDLQSILDGNRFNEFSLFYRVCHRTRLPRTAEDSTSCWLEKYFQLSIEQGGRVREKLRDGVEDALKTLGTGFLRHPKNETLRELVKTGTLTAAEFHRQLLRLVYRLLFLMVAEERRMIVPEGPEADRRQSLFDRYYSVGRLRSLAEKTIEPGTFGDLWIGLQQTFALFEDGDSNPLGIPPLNGDLFSAAAVTDLQGTHLYNNVLLAAIGRLSLFEDHGVRQRVNYSALDVEELGSVYESLLDYQPVITDQMEGTSFELPTGSERKSTGSYYTRPELVRELIESALVPVMQERLAGAKDSDPARERGKKQQAILSMSVCDPACGSGHFLLAAARRLGRELAKVRTGEEEPTPKEFHLAVRDVIAHCIYGVDVNPLAVDLCKLALWLESHWTGKPLSFLDHRIKSGNSLIGVLDMEVLKDGIPDEAFSPVAGDDKKVASAFRKRNREEREGQPSLPFDPVVHVQHYADESEQFASIAEDTPADVRRKKEAYEKGRQKPDWWHDWMAANLWTAAFFLPLTTYDDPVLPTHDKFMSYVCGKHLEAKMESQAVGIATELRFFHWPLEFPEVFERSGFDVIIGNPPWEALQAEELKFFASKGAPDITDLAGAERKRAIDRLHLTDPSLAAGWQYHRRTIEALKNFARESGRFPLSAVGKINTFALFSELARSVLAKHSRAGLIVPTGIATDDTLKDFFADLVKAGALESYFGFKNERFLFARPVEHTVTFGLLTMLGSAYRAESIQFCWLAYTVEDMHDPRRLVTLNAQDLRLFNPNTRTTPVFRTRADAELNRKLYLRFPVLTDDHAGTSTWPIVFRQGLFNMTSDSGLFLHAEEPDSLPLYEAKMMHQYDHRWATYEGTEIRNSTVSEKGNADFEVTPKYWVKRDDVVANIFSTADRKCPEWLVGFRDIARATDERTAIFSILPLVGVGHKVPLLFLKGYGGDSAALFVANANSLVLDYLVRQKIGGTHFGLFVLKQLPFIPPHLYSAEDRTYIGSRVVELVYTSKALSAFADDLGYSGAPFEWSDDRRSQVRAELDAYYAHLYGLTRTELRYVLDPKDMFGDDFPSETFRVLKEREEKEYGEYRTRRLVLEAFDKFAESPRFRDDMPNRESAIIAPGRPNAETRESVAREASQQAPA